MIFNQIVSKHLDAWEVPSPEVLISTMENAPGGHERLSRVIRGLKRENIQLRDLSSQTVLDYLYCVDVVFQIEDLNGIQQTVAVDVTTSYVAIPNKIKKLDELSPALEAIGIKKCLVVYWTTTKDYPEILSSGKVYVIVDRLMEAVDGLALTDRFIGEVII